MVMMTIVILLIMIILVKMMTTEIQFKVQRVLKSGKFKGFLDREIGSYFSNSQFQVNLAWNKNAVKMTFPFISRSLIDNQTTCCR